MTRRKVAIYYAWSRPGETEAPLSVIENRFPALFESRRMLYPHFEDLRDPECFDQGIAGFLDHIMRRNFTAFIDLAGQLTGNAVIEVERVDDEGRVFPLDAAWLETVDTLLVISFDSWRSLQQSRAAAVAAHKPRAFPTGQSLPALPYEAVAESLSHASLSPALHAFDNIFLPDATSFGTTSTPW